MDAEIDLSKSDGAIARWLWDNLVPASGQSAWLQGEMLRAIEKLRWEAQVNGNINWDDRFVMFIAFLRDRLLTQNEIGPDVRESIAADLDRLENFLPPEALEDGAAPERLPYVEDDLYDRLTSHVVSFCRRHAELIPFEANVAQYR
jgi:hypothetical protein